MVIRHLISAYPLTWQGRGFLFILGNEKDSATQVDNSNQRDPYGPAVFHS